MFNNTLILAARSFSFVAILGCLGFAIWQASLYRNLEKAIIENGRKSHEEMLNFNSALGRANSRLDDTGKLLDYMSKDIAQEIRSDIEDRHAEIESIGRAVFIATSAGGGRASVRVVSPRNVLGANDGSSSANNGAVEVVATSHPSIAGDLGGLDETVYEWKLKDWRVDGTLKAVCGEEGDFEYKLSQQFELTEVRSDDGAHYVKMFELGPDGKHYGDALVTKSFDVVSRKPNEEKMYWWNPHLDIAGGIDLGKSTQIEVGFSAMGYGKTEDDLSWKFLRIGPEYDSRLGVVACPVSYNVGGPLPLLSNVWLSPCYKNNGGHGASLSVGAQL